MAQQPSDFSLQDLYDALDAQRKTRGLSWSQAASEINGPPKRISARRLSSSTVTGTHTRAVAEGDGVLQMLRWLNRTPESFVPRHQESEELGARLPDIPSHQILRFDTRKLHAALDAQRIEKKMTWTQIAKELGLGVSTLTYLSKGGRTGFPQVMRIVRWLGRPAAHFTRASDW
ncbi:MAG: hypothetical protein WA854_11065 [Candidatus Binataceae bacterium]